MSSLIAKPLSDKDTVQQLRTCFSVNGSQSMEEAAKYAESLTDPAVKEVALGILLHPLYLPFSKFTHFDRLVSDCTRVSEDPDFVKKEFAEERELARFVCDESRFFNCYKRSIRSKNPDAAEYFVSFPLSDQKTDSVGLNSPWVFSQLGFMKMLGGYIKAARTNETPGTLNLSWLNSDQDLLLVSGTAQDLTQESMQVTQYVPRDLRKYTPKYSEDFLDTSGTGVKEFTRCTLVETSQFLKRFVEMRDSLRLFSCFSSTAHGSYATEEVRTDTAVCPYAYRKGEKVCELHGGGSSNRLFQVADSPDVSCIAIRGDDMRVTPCTIFPKHVNPDVFMRVQGVWFSCQAMSMKSSSSSLALGEPWKLSNGTTLNLSKGTFESEGHSYSMKEVAPTFDQHGIMAPRPDVWGFSTLAPSFYHPDELDESQVETARTIGLPVPVVRLIYQYALGGFTLPRGLLASEPCGVFRSMNQCAKLSEITLPAWMQ